MSTSLRFKKLDDRAILPAYQTAGAAGFDFHAIEDSVIQMSEVTLVRTGLAIEIPEGFELQIRARSGLSAKHGVFLVNGVGTIDSDYRGEIKIIMSTCLRKALTIKAGDRIAQGVFVPVERARIELSERLSDTERAEGGFGSTGRGNSVPISL